LNRFRKIVSTFIILSFVFTFFSFPVNKASAVSLITGYRELVQLGGGAQMELYIQMPKTAENYLASKKFPALVYLHDSVSGPKISRLCSNPGSEDFWPSYIDQKLEIPIFVIAPKFSGTKIDWSTKATAVIKALISMEAKYSIDTTRLFVGGNSVGGDGAFYVSLAGKNYTPAVNFTGLFDTNPTVYPSETAISSMSLKTIWIMQGKNNPNFDVGDRLANRLYMISKDVTYMQFNSKDKIERMMLDENLISMMLSRPGSNIGTTVFFPVASPIPYPKIVIGKSTGNNSYQLLFPNLLGVTDYTLTSLVKYPMVIELYGSGGIEGNGLNFMPTSTQFGFFKLIPSDATSQGQSTQSPAQLAAIVDELVSKYPIDPDKITIMGYSLGGINVFENIKAYPNKYAGIVSSNGSASGFTSAITSGFEELYKISHVPIFLTHDIGDGNNPVRYEKAVVEFSILSQLGANVVFMSQSLNSTHMPRVDNRGLGVYSWCLRQDRKNNINTGVPAGYKPPVPKLDLLTNFTNIITGTTNPYTTVKLTGPGVSSTFLTDSKGAFSYNLRLPNPAYPPIGSVYKLTVNGLYGTAGPETSITLVDGTPPNIPLVSKLKPLCKTLSGKTSAGFMVYVQYNDKIIASKMADASGTFNIPIAGYKPGTELYVYVNNTYGISSDNAYLSVSSLQPPKANKLLKYVKTISGTSEAGTTVYVKYANKVVASGKTSTKGKFSIKIKGYKKGVNLYLSAKNAYGYSSVSSKVTVF